MNPSRGGYDIWAMRDGGDFFHRASQEPVQLTNGPMGFLAPLPSKDGKKLFAVGTLKRGEVLRYDVRSRQFAVFLPGLSADGLAFSRDGQWMSYVKYPEGTLWRSRLDGSERLQLTFSPLMPGLAEWSPDGKQIAFSADTPGKPHHIYIVSADGGSPRQVAPEDRSQSHPTWSPDGSSLVFDRLFWEVDDPSLIGLHQVNLSTGEVTEIPGSEGMWHARWSPDGRYLAAQGTPDSRTLMLFDWTTRQWSEYVRGVPGAAAYSTWSRDSQYVYFENGHHVERFLYRLRVRDRKVEQLGGLDAMRQTAGTVTLWMGLAPDDSPLIMRDLGSSEIYALDLQAP
jgi:Tol biopolymer transport system component